MVLIIFGLGTNIQINATTFTQVASSPKGVSTSSSCPPPLILSVASGLYGSYLRMGCW